MCRPFQPSECLVADRAEEEDLFSEDMAYYELFQEQFAAAQGDNK